MRRVQAYLDATTHELLRDHAAQNNCSLSHAAGNIIASYLMGEEHVSKNQLENKQQFLRLLNVLNQVLMCVYDDKRVSIESTSARECLDKIKHLVRESTKKGLNE